MLLDADGERVLLEHRSDCDLWGLFGGGVDDHEMVAAAVQREVREETGLELGLAAELPGFVRDKSVALWYVDHGGGAGPDGGQAG